MNVKIQFKKLDPEVKLPKQAHPGDAGMDLYANEDVMIYPRKYTETGFNTGVVVVDCGFAMALPGGWEAQIRPRSGLATKKSLTIINSPGTIDAGYRGPVKVGLINLGLKDVHVTKGMRIAQMVISEVPAVDIEEVNELPPSERGEEGFGSTGL